MESAINTVLALPELLKQIIFATAESLDCDGKGVLKELFALTGVNSTFRNITLSSPKLRRLMFLPRITTEANQKPDVGDILNPFIQKRMFNDGIQWRFSYIPVYKPVLFCRVYPDAVGKYSETPWYGSWRDTILSLGTQELDVSAEMHAELPEKPKGRAEFQLPSSATLGSLISLLVVTYKRIQQRKS